MGIIATDIVPGGIRAMILSGITHSAMVAWPMVMVAMGTVHSDIVVSIVSVTGVGTATIPTTADLAIR